MTHHRERPKYEPPWARDLGGMPDRTTIYSVAGGPPIPLACSSGSWVGDCRNGRNAGDCVANGQFAGACSNGLTVNASESCLSYGYYAAQCTAGDTARQ